MIFHPSFVVSVKQHRGALNPPWCFHEWIPSLSMFLRGCKRVVLAFNRQRFLSEKQPTFNTYQKQFFFSNKVYSWLSNRWFAVPLTVSTSHNTIPMIHMFSFAIWKAQLPQMRTAHSSTISYLKRLQLKSGSFSQKLTCVPTCSLLIIPNSKLFLRS